MRESMKAVRRRIYFGSLLLVMASVAACSMTSGGSSGGPPYTVTYRNTTANTTGSVPVDSTQYASGATVTVMGNTGNLSWSGFTFKGWDTTDSGQIPAATEEGVEGPSTLLALLSPSPRTSCYMAPGILDPFSSRSSFHPKLRGCVPTHSQWSHFRKAVFLGSSAVVVKGRRLVTTKGVNTLV